MPTDNQQNPTTPINPELEAVQANQPAAQKPAEAAAVPATTPKKAVTNGAKKVTPLPTIPVPKKIGPEVKKPSKTKFMLGCAGGFIVLFVIFITLMVLMMSRAGADNPVMRAFGLDPAGIKRFLLTVVSLSFGMLSLLFFVLLVIGLFRLLGAKKTDKEAKKKGMRMTLFTLIPFVLILFIWFVLYNFIGRVQIAAEQVIAEIVVVQPEDLENLQAPVEITFSALNVAKALEIGGFKIDAMNWDLEGDGTFGTPVNANPEVSHIYNKKGIYTVALQVRVAGETTFRPPYTKIINIPNAVFAAEPPTGFPPLAVDFDASGLVPKGFKVQSLDWDFNGDGKYELEGPDNLRPHYTFEQIGVFNVHLRVIDQQNNVENYYRNIEVVESKVPLVSGVITATPGLSGPIPFQVRFDAGESQSLKGKIINYEWDFGDGSDLQSGKSVSHVFQTPGVYTVTLNVEDDLGMKSASTVQVEAKKVSSVPEAAFSTDPAFDTATMKLNGVLPFAVSFDALPSVDADNDIVDYKWDFNGDGQVDQEGKKVDYTFEEAKDYQVTLTVTDSENQSGTSAITVTVATPGVQAVIKADPEEGTVPLIVNFDGSGSSAYEGKIVSYEWDFGDGSPKTITGSTVSHKYSAVGNYTVKLNVVTNKSLTGETSQIIYVREIPLRACFTPSRYNGSAPLAVTFDSKCSTGGISKFTWDFGDDSTSDDRKPTHTFEFPGSYTVTLEVSDDKNNVSDYSEVIVAEGEVAQ